MSAPPLVLGSAEVARLQVLVDRWEAGAGEALVDLGVELREMLQRRPAPTGDVDQLVVDLARQVVELATLLEDATSRLRDPSLRQSWGVRKRRALDRAAEVAAAVVIGVQP